MEASLYFRVGAGGQLPPQRPGLVMDVQTNEVVVAGLSMPHSPRFYRDRLWLLESGAGRFGYVDRDKKCFVPVVTCPGYLRGLNFIGDYAVVGLSLPRNNKNFQDLALDKQLEVEGGAQCGIQVIDLRTGEIVHHLFIQGIVEELYDVVVLADTVRPMALGFKSDEIHRFVNIQ